MSNAKHTPGPWEAFKTTISANEPQDIPHDVFRGFDTAEYGSNGDKYLIAESVAMKANASLIAAAPDMLIALEAAEEWLDGWASAYPYIDTIRAAIAKAKGEANET